MKKTIMMAGGIGAGIILILVAFTSVVNAQATRATINDLVSSIIKGKSKLSLNDRVQILKHISDNFKNLDSPPRGLLFWIWAWIGGLVIWFGMALFTLWFTVIGPLIS